MGHFYLVHLKTLGQFARILGHFLLALGQICLGSLGQIEFGTKITFPNPTCIQGDQLFKMLICLFLRQDALLLNK